MDMEEFKKRLRLKMILFAAEAIASLTVYIVFSAIKYDGRSFSSGFISGFCAVTVLFSVLQAVQIGKAAKNSDKLQKMYIEYTDERSRFIREKVSSGSFYVCIFALVPAMIASAFLSKTVLLVLIGVLCFMALVNICFELYYKKKY